MNATELINRFPEIKEEYNSIAEKNRHYIVSDMEKCIKRVKSAKLNGVSLDGFRKKREWSYTHTDDYFTDVEGFEEYLFSSINPEITEGTPCTILLYSDSYGCSVTSVKRNKQGHVVKVGVRKYDFTLTDWQDGEGVLEDTMYGEEEYFTLRKNGGWFQEGQPKSRGSVQLAMGYARTYRDPSF